MVVKGHVTKIANFGVFVELEPGLEGLLHISEISRPESREARRQLKVGQELDVKILRVDSEERKIGLSLKLRPVGPGRRDPRSGPMHSEPRSAACAAAWKAANRPAAWAISTWREE